jgi:hypothetical protein
VEKLRDGVVGKVFVDKPTKSLHLCSSESIADLATVVCTTSQHFGLLIAFDARGVEWEAIESVAEKLIGKGLVYLCAWGPDCERVHDAFDDASVELNAEATVDDVIMTTWHSNEGLTEALWFFVNSAYPTRSYEHSCSDWVIAIIGNPQWEQIVRGAIGRE